MFRGQMGRKGLTILGICHMTNFPLLSPDFLFDVSGPAQKSCARVFFWFFGVVFMTFFFQVCV
jgi:hypothetical protein